MIRDYHVFLALNKGYIEESEELTAATVLAKGIKMTDIEISMFIARKNDNTNAKEYKHKSFAKEDVNLFILEGRVIHESKSDFPEEIFENFNDGGDGNGLDNQ